MATTTAGAELTRRHRAAQLALRARTLRAFLPIWAVLDVASLRRTWPAVEESALGLIAQQRPVSAAMAAAYYQGFRLAEGESDVVDIRPVPMIAEDAARARTSLRVTGLATIQRLEAVNAPNPLATSLVRVSGALARHVLDGGRATVLDAVSRDRRSMGWQRVTAGKCCAFCAMLASRGPVYSKARGGFRAHDHCACHLEPVFSRTSEWPGQAREFRELWDASKQDAEAEGISTAVAFRRAYEGRAA